MVVVCCFQCDPRLATYIISILSILHFTVETILLSRLDTQHRLVAEDDGIKFYTVFTTHIFLLVASFMLFFAAYTLVRFLCIPWLIGCAFNLIIYLALLVLVILRVLSGSDTIELEKGAFLIMTIATIAYCMWIVLVFFLELGKDSPNQGDGDRARSKSMFTLYDDTETDGEDEEKALSSSQRTSRRNSKGHVSEKDDQAPLLPSSKKSSRR